MADLRDEYRAASLVDAEVKGRTVRGLAAVYDQPWHAGMIEKSGYVEKFARGAFRKALQRKEYNVPLLWQHERKDMLATTNNNTLRIRDDPKGLYFEGDLPENPLGEYVHSMVERGDANGVSVGINSEPLKDSTVTRSADGKYERTINNIHHLLDVSLTYEPTYPAAVAELRSMGFVALPLQDLLAGSEEQLEDTAAEVTSIEAIEYVKRERDLRLAILERGGVL